MHTRTLTHAHSLTHPTHARPQTRSSRNFCLDATLICILLGLALYLYQMFRKK